ncbi:10160_t:CDS:2 [Dentiscutata heterogama]|uniref:10160_t:CDS:1 n=1 Tax=Dentiscutata heterogama TaxID=1316150 RepID=A0ACA9KSQ4_9GLOM|nr:10160_t:CDS:2 [Dentiscutata heterogama]
MGCNTSKNISTKDVKIIISKDNVVNTISTTIIDDEKFPFPKKDYGGDRLALQHHIFKYIWQSNFSAPVNEKLETGAKYPNSSFFGVERPTSVLRNLTPPVPSSVSLQYCDILSRLPFEDETFDFIYVRFMASEIPDNKFNDIINELTRILKIDGYLEIMDVDVRGGNEGIETQEFMSSGKNPLITESLEPLLHSNSQLTSITTENQVYPIGNWDNPIGEMTLKNLLMVLKQIKIYLAPYIKVNEDEYDRKLLNIKEEVNFFQTYWNSMRVYGKKLA